MSPKDELLEMSGSRTCRQPTWYQAHHSRSLKASPCLGEAGRAGARTREAVLDEMELKASIKRTEEQKIYNMI